MNQRLDSHDLKILAMLQKDARCSIAEIARKIHLSQPSVSERIKRLETSGVIQGYHAVVDPEALGYHIVALIRISAQQGRPYVDYAIRQPEVIDCYTVTGEDGAILKVLATDVKHLQSIIDQLNKFGSTSTAIILCVHVAGKAVSVPNP